MSQIEGWHKKRFDQFGTLLSGSTPSTSIGAFWDGNIVWVTPYDLSRLKTPYLEDTAKKITQKGLDACSAQLLPARSVVMSSRAPIGYVAIPSVDFCTNQGCKSIELKSGYDSEFSYYNILFNIEKVKALGEGTTFAEISKAALSAVELEFPDSKSEQTKIAEVLSTVDRAIEQTEALIAKQQRIKTGLMQDLLTKGIDKNGNLRSEATHEFKDSPLGRIPVEWDVVSLNDLCTDIVDCPHTTPGFLSDGVLVARTFNLKDGQFVGDRSYVSEEEYKSRVSRLEPKSGDVIFTREAPVGEAFVVPDKLKICLGQRTMILRSTVELLLPNYLLEVIYSEEMRIRFDNMVGGTTNPHLNVADVRALSIRTPSVTEQTLISDRIQGIRSVTFETRKHLEKLAALKAALMQDLLTGKKRVTPLLEPATTD
ncbi:MAG: restriction endonuclease subunit S [Candidatus Thiodiazotropha sp.]